MRLYLMTAASVALFAGACDGRGDTEIHTTYRGDKARLTPVSSLECPEREGDLRLASRDAGGRSCFYRGDDGAEVELKLVALDGGTAEATLDRLQQELAPLVPAAAAPPEPPSALEPPEAALPENVDESTRVRVPGLMDIRSQGEHASIRLPGVSIEASDGRADIRVDDEDGEKVLVNAHDGGAVIHADSTKGGDVRSTYLLASETPGPTGLRVVGYSVRGPAAGPLVIGVARAKSERRRGVFDPRGVFDDMEDLVKDAARDRRR
jgi:hypothetical protein